MLLSKKVKLILKVLAVAVLAIGSVLTGVLVNEKYKTKIQSSPNLKDGEKPQDFLARNKLERYDLSHKINPAYSFSSALDYQSNFAGFVVPKINESQFEIVLINAINDALKKDVLILGDKTQFSGKIYYSINNIALTANVIVAWKNNDLVQNLKYYDAFQVSFVLE